MVNFTTLQIIFLIYFIINMFITYKVNQMDRLNRLEMIAAIFFSLPIVILVIFNHLKNKNINKNE